MCEREKNQPKIYDLLKADPAKYFEIVGVSLWSPASPDLNSLDYG